MPKRKSNFIKYLSKAILTPILLIVYSDKYGVYNNRSYRVMRELDLFDELPHKLSSSGLEYKAVNTKLLEIANSLNLTLWQLDYLWWYYELYGHEYLEQTIDNIRIMCINYSKENYERTIQTGIMGAKDTGAPYK